MKKSIKASLLSAFVIPGAGHFYLKCYAVGFLLIGMSLASLYVLVSIAVEKATVIANMILNGEVAAEIGSVIQLVRSEVASANTSSANLATIILVIVWGVAVLDSYRVGKKQENSE